MNDVLVPIAGLLLIAASAFFVAAEYAIVSARESKIAPAAKKGNPIDRLALKAIHEQTRFVAGTQVMITLLGIAIGAVLEPWLSGVIAPIFPAGIPPWLVSFVSIVIVSYPLVVLGELVPKYLALQNPESALRFVVGPLRILVILLKPVIWLFQTSGQLVLKSMRVPTDGAEAVISREELYYLIKAGEEGGGMHENHADFVTKALRLDELDAEDAMLHRLDIKWLDVSLSKEEVLEKIPAIPHSRIPICRGDIDDLVGIAYLHDIVCHLNDPDFSLERIVRQPVYVPESLTLNRLVEIMRETKSQIAIVQDEYGGTQGLVTLEDIIEEVFGDMEDHMESERPAIERTSPGRISLRPDVRYDELLEYLGYDPALEETYTTESLAGIIVEKLGRTAGLGDTVELEIGRFRVEQAAQRRITRIGFYPRPRQNPEPQVETED